MKFLKSFFKIIIITFIILLSLGVFIILKWGMPGMGDELPGYSLTKTYLTIGDYSIGKQKFITNICHKTKGCLNGEILGTKTKDGNIYFHYKINFSTFSSVDNITHKENIEGYNYEIYNLGESKDIKELNQLPEFGFVDNNGLKWYSDIDLKTLDKNKQKIFNDLKQSTIIEINGIRY